MAVALLVGSVHVRPRFNQCSNDGGTRPNVGIPKTWADIVDSKDYRSPKKLGFYTPMDFLVEYPTV